MKNFTLLTILSLLSVITFGQEATFNWVQTELNPGHNLKTMSSKGNEAFIAGYGNSLFTTADNGENWKAVNIFKAEYSFPDFSIKGNTGYAVGSRVQLYDASHDVYTNGIILKTNDAGATWTNIDLNSLNNGGDASVNPTDTLCYGLDFLAVETVNDSVAYCALRWNEYTEAGKNDHVGIFKTADSAKSWINISGDLGSTYIKSIVYNDSEVFIGGNKYFMKTTPDSNELTDIFASLNGGGSEYIWDITLRGDSELYVTTSTKGVFYSTDGGETFNKFGTITSAWDTYRLNDSTVVVGGGSNKSYVTTDNGTTWNSLGISTSIWEIAGEVNDSLYLLAGATIYKIAVSDITSGNYSFNTQDVAYGNLNDAYIDGDKVFIVGNDLSFVTSTDGGQNWSDVTIPEIAPYTELMENIDFVASGWAGDTAYLSLNRVKFVDYSDKDDIYWSGGIIYSTDNWETYKTVDVAKVGKANETDPAMNPNHEKCNAVNPSYLIDLGNKTLLLWAGWFDYSTGAKVEHSMVFKTEDTGKNWTPFTEDLGSNYLQDIAIDGDLIYLGGKDLLLKSTNAGASFTNIYPNLDIDEDDDMFINSVWIGDEGEVFVTTSVDGVYKSVDGGDTFTQISDASGSTVFYKFDHNSYIFLGSTSGKSLFTNNDGETWQACHPGAAVFDINIYNEKLYAIARGSIYTVDLNDLELTTSSPLITNSNVIKLQYHTDHINVVSSNNYIESCYVYSMSGKLVNIVKPNSNICRLNNYDYKPGLYIISAEVEGQKYVDKVVFK